MVGCIAESLFRCTFRRRTLSCRSESKHRGNGYTVSALFWIDRERTENSGFTRSAGAATANGQRYDGWNGRRSRRQNLSSRHLLQVWPLRVWVRGIGGVDEPSTETPRVSGSILYGHRKPGRRVDGH